jgi:IS5 family transposase
MDYLSDHPLERFLQENVSGKLFCAFNMTEKTPDHTYFSELHKRIGTSRLGELFNLINDKLRSKGLVSNIFTFVDASTMISKLALWDERDKALKAGEENHWYGYKRNVAVCMKNGFITKVTARVMAMNGCHNGAIKKNNMKAQNHQKDNFLSGLSMPYESTFSKIDKHVRYCGLAKV